MAAASTSSSARPGATPAGARDDCYPSPGRVSPGTAECCRVPRWLSRALPFRFVLDGVRPALRALTARWHSPTLACVNVGNLPFRVRASSGDGHPPGTRRPAPETYPPGGDGKRGCWRRPGSVGSRLLLTLIRALWVVHRQHSRVLIRSRWVNARCWRRSGSAGSSAIAWFPAVIAVQGVSDCHSGAMARSGGNRGRRPLRQWLVGSEMRLPSHGGRGGGSRPEPERLYGSLGYSADHLAAAGAHGASDQGRGTDVCSNAGPDSPSVARCARYPGRHPVVVPPIL